MKKKRAILSHAGCYQLCLSMNVCTHNTCLLSIKWLSSWKWLVAAASCSTNNTFSAAVVEIWARDSATAAEICVEKTRSDTSNYIGHYTLNPSDEQCVPISFSPISLIKSITRSGLMQIVISGLGVDIHTIRLLTRLSHAAWAINVISGDF